jgi:ssDNA-binding Zn-finger/Zn-ribbon topoisomerase 1
MSTWPHLSEIVKPENVKCPECGGTMVSRLNKATQQRFWGCMRFPKCKGTRDTDGMSKQERTDARRPERSEDDDPDD